MVNGNTNLIKIRSSHLLLVFYLLFTSRRVGDLNMFLLGPIHNIV